LDCSIDNGNGEVSTAAVLWPIGGLAFFGDKPQTNHLRNEHHVGTDLTIIKASIAKPYFLDEMMSL
jgi:hypothetical protein